MKPILLALLLAGCGQLNYRPNAYEWSQDAPPSTHYRWEVVDRADTTKCGRLAVDAWLRGWACAIRLYDAVLDRATDRYMPPDWRFPVAPLGPDSERGRLCLIYSTMTEEEAIQERANMDEQSLWHHEMQHCRGWTHRMVFKP